MPYFHFLQYHFRALIWVFIVVISPYYAQVNILGRGICRSFPECLCIIGNIEKCFDTFNYKWAILDVMSSLKQTINLHVKVTNDTWIDRSLSHHRELMPLGILQLKVKYISMSSFLSWYPSSMQTFQKANISTMPILNVYVPYFLVRLLKHWGRDEMNNTSQTTFSNVFSSMKMFEFRLKFQWSVFLRVQLTTFQHWFR